MAYNYHYENEIDLEDKDFDEIMDAFRNKQYIDFERVSKREDVTIEVVRKYIQFSWEWGILSRKFPIKEILENQDEDFEWDWKAISGRKDLDIEIVKENLNNAEWDWDYIRVNILWR